MSGWWKMSLKNQIINEVSPFILEKTGRKPIILPVLMNIKNNG